MAGGQGSDYDRLVALADYLKENYEFDVIVFPGDWTDINSPKGFTQLDVAILLVEELKRLKKPIIAVPGNMDTREIVELLKEEKISVHGEGKIVGDVGFYGYGGAKTPFKTNLEPTDEELRRGLQESWNVIKDSKIKVQVNHVPPYQTKVDLIASGLHVGSKIVREFIEDKKPNLVVCAHIHEGRGTEIIGNSFIINPGRFPEGYCGFVEIDNDGKVSGRVENIL